ncbi:MAG: hypothetical protein HC913_24110 [Microscillaceae bacterium]|nr:hypothetical protein [Microscillaceae bacterium]
MKQKNAIILLTVMLILLSIYRLSFTLTDRAIQQSATEYATDKRGIVNLDKKQKYLDSLWNKPVYNVLVAEYTYKEVKEMSLSLGLDLQGGMHVTLEVSPVEIIKALANNSRDAKFQQALTLAQKRQATSQASFVSLFGAAYAEVAPGEKLSKIFTNTTTRGKIDLKSTDTQILDIINQEMEDAFDRSFNIIRTRIDKFGVSNPTIQKLPGTNRILVELPGVDNPKRVRKLLSGVAKLEFWEVWETQDLIPYYQEFAAYLEREESKNQAKTGKKPSKGDGGLVAKSDSNAQKGKDPLVADEEDTSAIARLDTASKKTDTLRKDKPKADSLKKDTTDAAGNLAAQLMQPSYEGFVVRTRDTARVNELLSRSEVQRLFPSNLRFMWDVKGNEAAGNITLYAIKTGRGGKAPLSGEVVIEARNDFDENNRPSVSMQMNATGARGWRKLTAENVGKRIAIALDNYVYSAPRVNGEIPNGSSVITGNFTVNEAKDLANVLKAGKLPAPVRVVEEATVGPSLGKESIQQGLNSMLLGLGLVIVFMILYYRSSGVVANIALS